MNKTKTLGFLVGLLALINIGLVIFLFLGIPKGPRPGGINDKAKAEKFIQKKFGFDEEQMSQFRESKNNHMQKAKELDSDLEALSREYYVVKGKRERDSLLNRINEVSSKIYDNNSIHFDEVRSICNSDQLSEMEDFINSLLNHNQRGRNRGDNKKRK